MTHFAPEPMAHLDDGREHEPSHGSRSPNRRPPTNRDIVRATLRVDDSAAATCSYVPEPGRAAPTPDPIAVEIFCRERLVLDSFEVIGTDDFPGG